jgi:hypothetical protein
MQSGIPDGSSSSGCTYKLRTQSKAVCTQFGLLISYQRGYEKIKRQPAFKVNRTEQESEWRTKERRKNLKLTKHMRG